MNPVVVHVFEDNGMPLGKGDWSNPFVFGGIEFCWHRTWHNHMASKSSKRPRGLPKGRRIRETAALIEAVEYCLSKLSGKVVLFVDLDLDRCVGMQTGAWKKILARLDFPWGQAGVGDPQDWCSSKPNRMGVLVLIAALKNRNWTGDLIIATGAQTCPAEFRVVLDAQAGSRRRVIYKPGSGIGRSLFPVAHEIVMSNCRDYADHWRFYSEPIEERLWPSGSEYWFADNEAKGAALPHRSVVALKHHWLTLAGYLRSLTQRPNLPVQWFSADGGIRGDLWEVVKRLTGAFANCDQRTRGKYPLSLGAIPLLLAAQSPVPPDGDDWFFDMGWQEALKDLGDDILPEQSSLGARTAVLKLAQFLENLATHDDTREPVIRRVSWQRRGQSTEFCVQLSYFLPLTGEGDTFESLAAARKACARTGRRTSDLKLQIEILPGAPNKKSTVVKFGSISAKSGDYRVPGKNLKAPPRLA